jgi:hypothetical protein
MFILIWLTWFDIMMLNAYVSITVILFINFDCCVTLQQNTKRNDGDFIAYSAVDVV